VPFLFVRNKEAMMPMNQSIQSFGSRALALYALMVVGQTASLAADQVAAKQSTLPKPGEAQFLSESFREFEELEELVYQPFGVELRLPNGNVLTFIATRDDRGEVEALAFAELRRAKNRGIASIPDLAKAKLPEIFHALSKPGTSAPSFLRLVRSEPTRSRSQGWARNLVLSGGAVGDVLGNPQLVCPQTSWSWNGFREDILGKGLPLSALYEGDGPQSKPKHWRESEGEFRLKGSVHDVPEFYGSVLYCARDTLDHVDDHDPRVVWRFGETDGDYWNPQYNFLPHVGDQFTFTFDTQEKNLPTSVVGKGYSVELFIESAELGDKFYVGATWSKISGTLTTPQ
jgi:hypothetical protein